MQRLPGKKLLFTAVLAAGLTACGGGGGDSASSTSNGSLRIALTDAPSCGYDAVNVTIKSVRVNKSASAADSDSGWSEIALTTPRKINLLNLSNGVLEELGQTPLPTGKYTQLRLILADNDSASPLANSVLPTGGAEVALKTPSGQQSGVKTNIDIDIAANKMADFVIDFNACKSIVSAGNSGQYLLKPVVSVIPRYVAGVSGFVATDLANGSTSVSLQQGGVIIKATAPDTSGRFLLQPVAPGSYTLVFTAPGRTTAAVTGVSVAADTVTAINVSGSALATTVSASGVIQGNAPLNTQVRVMQSLAVGPTIEVAGRYVDGASGNYSFAAVVNAPLVATYAPSPASLVFVPDLTAAGRYSVLANLAGFPDKIAVLPTVSVGTATTANFTFP